MATPVNITEFPDGFGGDVSIRGIPVLITYSGRQVWVDSNGPGPGASKGTFKRPYLTVSTALNAAQNNDTIMVKSGHTETITAAGGWTFATSVANTAVTGVKVIGLGLGNERPQITFSTATTASVVMSSAGSTLMNIIGIAGVNALANPINVQASDCTVDIEWRDQTSKEALRAILTNASAVNCILNVKYVGFASSTTNVNAIRLVGANNIRANLDYYGNTTTAVVEFLTTAGKNTVVTGVVNNAASANTNAKIVVDTVTGSHFAVNVLDISSASVNIPYQHVA